MKMTVTDKERNNIRFQLQTYMFDVLKDLGYEPDLEKLQILDAKDERFGDYSSNEAMILAKKLKKNPREIAQNIVDKIESDENKPNFIKRTEVAGPGFVNFILANSYFHDLIGEIIKQGDDYGKMEVGKGKKVMIEYGQPNTHKAIHMGHVRSAISGIFIISLLETFGFEVIKVNFFGDVGMHVAKCIWGVKMLGVPEGILNSSADEKLDFLQKAYVFGANSYKDNAESESEIRQINKDVYSKDNPEVNKLYDLTRSWSIEHQKDVFNILGVKYDREYPESELAKSAKEIVLKNTPGIFKKDQGAIIFEGEKYGFHNRVFFSKDGVVTYEGKDLMLAVTKNKEYDFDQSYIFTAIDHKDYFDVVTKAVEQVVPELTDKYGAIQFGFLLVRGKKESSRSGISMTGKQLIMSFVDLEKKFISEREDLENKAQVAQKIGIAALRYMILSHPFNISFSINPEEALSVDGNSAPYIMYAYTRANSILSTANTDNGKQITENLELHYSKIEEIELLKHLSKYEDVLVNSFNKLTPHLLALYLFELAQLFNKFYKACSVLDADEEDKVSRLYLTQAVAQVLSNGLKVLGIDVLEKM